MLLGLFEAPRLVLCFRALFSRATVACIVLMPSRGPGTYDCLSWPTKNTQHRDENVPAYHQ